MVLDSDVNLLQIQFRFTRPVLNIHTFFSLCSFKYQNSFQMKIVYIDLLQILLSLLFAICR
jgi:hypothetical protein